MQAILRLLENDRVVGVHHFISDFLAAMRRQAMHKSRVPRGFSHEFGVHLVWTEYLSPLIRLALLTHARPRIGVNRIDPCDGRMWIGKQLDSRPSLFRDLPRIGDNLR